MRSRRKVEVAIITTSMRWNIKVEFGRTDLFLNEQMNSLLRDIQANLPLYEEQEES